VDLHNGNQTHFDVWLRGLVARVRNKVSKMELNKLQKLACLAITGAMRTTPTAAMVVLLVLPPLHVIIEAEAQTAIYRLICNCW
jgi:hypothetical protein